MGIEIGAGLRVYDFLADISRSNGLGGPHLEEESFSHFLGVWALNPAFCDGMEAGRQRSDRDSQDRLSKLQQRAEKLRVGVSLGLTKRATKVLDLPMRGRMSTSWVRIGVE